MNEEKLKALDAVLAQIEKAYGKGAIMKLGEDAGNTDIETIPTGCLALDLALGIGGIPRGRMIEIYGPESSGKTTVALHAVAQAQAAGGIAAFVDAEHALDPVYAKKLGVKLDELYVSQPDTGEQALDIVDSLVRSSAVDIIVVDSVAALTPKAEIEGDMGDSHVGLQARLMSQALRKLTAIVNKSKTCVVFINQLREKVGVKGAEILRFHPHRRAQDGYFKRFRRRCRQPYARKGGKKQIGASLPSGGIRHYVRRRDLARRLLDRFGRTVRRDQKERRVVQL